MYLLDVRRERLDYPELKRAVREQAQRFQASNILIEDKASGTKLIQELKRDGVYGVARYQPTMDKIMRMHSVSTTIENGFVYLPKQAAWLDQYRHELISFPNGKHDDQVDSTSQALDWIKNRVPVFAVAEYLRRQALKEGFPLEPWLQDASTGNNEPEEFTAFNPTTGQRIRWDGCKWVDCQTGECVT